MNSEVNMTLEERLKCSYSYDPSTGKIFWKDRNQGRETFKSQTNDYLQANFRGTILKAHRVAWLLHYGEWPEGSIDHINGDRTDNRLSNLRVVDHRQNGRNCKVRCDNKTGVTGVSKRNDTGKWSVRIHTGVTYKTLGSFSCLGQAIKARREAEKVYGFHENHGRR